MIGLSEFWRSCFRCEDLILLFFCLQIGNDKMLKPNNEICLKSKYQLKQKTISREKILQLIKIAFFEKWIFSNSFIIYFQSSTKVFSTTGTSHRMTFSYVNSITGVTFVGKCPLVGIYDMSDTLFSCFLSDCSTFWCHFLVFQRF